MINGKEAGKMEAEPTSDTGKENTGIYSYNEVIKAATEYFKGDSLAANVWINKYA